MTEVALQTHFMGEPGSCCNYYEIGEQIPELQGYSGMLPNDEWLIGTCEQCDAWVSFDALLEDGRVVRLLEPVADAV